MKHAITVIPGDGIGPEIMKATLQVLEATGVQFEFERCVAGQGAEETGGHPLPQETIASLNRTQVGLKGPLIVEPGSPPVVVGPQTYGSTNGAMRGVCGAFANVRPAKRFDGVPGRFTDLAIDLVIVREVSEGIYVGKERVLGPDRAEAVVVATRSDVSSAVIGGLGLGPGGNYGKEIAFFEAIHGAAPDIAGRNIANPIALILSGAMMLDHLKEPAAAGRVRAAVETFLRKKEGLTPDLGGRGNTAGVAEAIARLVENAL